MENKPAKRETKAAKKKLLIAIAVILGVLLLLTGASYLIDFIEQGKLHTNVGEKEVNYNFYPADFEENIFENPDYLKLLDDGKIFIDFKEGGLTLGIAPEDAYKYGEDLKLMTDMLFAVINGNNDLYNGYFTDRYYESHSPKDEFTMQMLYNIKIERLSSGKTEAEDGSEYTKSVFTVEYRIFHNNGTFRRDIGAGSKKQYITVTNQGGEWRIDSISTVN